MKIGLIREGKFPYDKRVALTPQQCQILKEKYPTLTIACQPCTVRSYTNSEYENIQVSIQEDLKDCDFIFGIKEIPIANLIADKTYLFFSHTLKKQSYNRQLLQEILKKNITLIDYEAIVNDAGERLVAFGKYAGIVGAYNAFRTVGLKYDLFNLPPAYSLFDKSEMLAKLKSVALPKLKVVVTGNGRVARGVKEVLDEINIRQVSPNDFISNTYDEIVYTIPNSSDYYDLDGSFDRNIFYTKPEQFKSTFQKFTNVADMLVASAYWNPLAPQLFNKEDIQNLNFTIKIIADITCDINGSIPSTIKSSTIYDPFYDYNPFTHKVEAPFSNEKNITVMAIDNLPTELPRDASEFFGNQLIEHVFPAFMENKNLQLLRNSIIASNGKLSEKYAYLQGFVENR